MIIAALTTSEIVLVNKYRMAHNSLQLNENKPEIVSFCPHDSFDSIRNNLGVLLLCHIPEILVLHLTLKFDISTVSQSFDQAFTSLLSPRL